MKFRGSTLIETLVAMVIVVISFGSGMMVYLNVSGNSSTSKKSDACLVLQEVYHETMLQEDFFDENTETKGLTVEKKIEDYEGSDNLFVLRISVFSGEHKLLVDYREIISIK